MGKFSNFLAKIDPTTNKTIQSGIKLGLNAVSGGTLGDMAVGGLNKMAQANKTPQGLPTYTESRQTSVMSNNSALREAVGNAGKSFLGDVVSNLDRELSKNNPNYRQGKQEIIVSNVANKIVEFFKKQWKSLLIFGVSITLLITLFKYLKGRKTSKKSRF